MKTGIILTDAINVFKGSILDRYRLLQAFLEQDDPEGAISKFIGKRTCGLILKKHLSFIPIVTATYHDLMIKGTLVNSSKFILAYKGTLSELKDGQVFIAEDSDLARIYPQSCLNNNINLQHNGITIVTIEENCDDYKDD